MNMVVRQFCVDLRFIIDLFPLAFFARPLVLDVVCFRSKYLNIVFLYLFSCDESSYRLTNYCLVGGMKRGSFIKSVDFVFLELSPVP